MKSMKKIASLVLALVMALALAVPAMAASGPAKNETGKITIDNAIVGQTYTIYKIFDLESYSNATSTPVEGVGDDWSGNFSYKVVDAWRTFFTQTKEVDGQQVPKYGTVDNDGYVTSITDDFKTKPAAFAEAALKYATDNNINPAAEAVKAENENVTFSDLALGYYLVDSSAGALCSLNTTAPNVTIKEKNTAPTLDKQVQEDSNDEWGETNDADIGQTVNFKVTIHAKKGAQNYVMHDKMSPGLTFGSVTSVKVGGVDLNNGYYTVTTPTAPATALDDDCTFEVAFTQDYLDTLTENTDIVVEYTATLNEKAVIAGTGNDNDAKLTYGDSQETEWDKTKTYTYEFDLVKYYTEKNNDETVKKLLDGAEFTLYTTKTGEGENVVYGGEIKFTQADRVYTVSSDPDASTTITVTGGKVQLKGLDTDTYYLVETKAPAGYNAVSGDVTIIVAASNSTAEGAAPGTKDPSLTIGSTTSTKVNAETEEKIVDGTTVLVYKEGGVAVENNTGVALPETGGIGTTIFYVVGSVLALGAVILLVTKKRMSAK